jgi:hypothetical protein
MADYCLLLAIMSMQGQDFGAHKKSGPEEGRFGCHAN